MKKKCRYQFRLRTTKIALHILAKRLVLCAMVLLAAINFAYADDEGFAKNMHGVDQAIAKIVGDDYVGYKIVGTFVEVHFSNGKILRIDRNIFENNVLEPIYNAALGITPPMSKSEARQRWRDVLSRSADGPGVSDYKYLQRGCSPQEGFGALMGRDIQLYRYRDTGQFLSHYERPPAYKVGGADGLNPLVNDPDWWGQQKDMLHYSRCGEAGHNYWLKNGKNPGRVTEQVDIYAPLDYHQSGRGCIITYGPNSHVGDLNYDGALNDRYVRFIDTSAQAWGISPRPDKIDFETSLPIYNNPEEAKSSLGPGHPISRINAERDARFWGKKGAKEAPRPLPCPPDGPPSTTKPEFNIGASTKWKVAGGAAGFFATVGSLEYQYQVDTGGVAPKTAETISSVANVADVFLVTGVPQPGSMGGHTPGDMLLAYLAEEFYIRYAAFRKGRFFVDPPTACELEYFRFMGVEPPHEF